MVETFRGIKAQIIKIFVISNAVCIVIELYLCGILAEKFNIYLVPYLAIGGSCICKK